jgi:hypothetical protein
MAGNEDATALKIAKRKNVVSPFLPFKRRLHPATKNAGRLQLKVLPLRFREHLDSGSF